MSDKISENPLQTQLQRIKSQGRQVDADLGGLNIPMLTKAMSAIQQGQQLSGQYSQQLGMFMKIVDPILNYSNRNYRRINWVIGLEYGSTLDQIKSFTESISSLNCSRYKWV